MTRSVLRPIRTRRVARSSLPPANDTQGINSITPGTRKTLAAIGALWVSFAVSASVNPASASPVQAPRAQPTPTLPVSETQVSPARREDGLELYANSHAPRVEKLAADHRRPVAGGQEANSSRLSEREFQGTVFLKTGTRADRPGSGASNPDSRVAPTASATALAYLKSVSK